MGLSYDEFINPLSGKAAMSQASMHPDIQRVREFLIDLQARICTALEQQEQLGGGTATFVADDWTRFEGGGGRSCVLQGGEVIEKGGVMFSHINIKN